tara:strand:- start:355 stop:873 length:519 start_codon:yes stop_codon:yes gene_type:complete
MYTTYPMNFWNTNKGRQLKSNAAKTRKEEYGEKYTFLIERLNDLNKMGKLYGFIKDMHEILSTGSRPFSENMYKATVNAISKPEFDEAKMVEQKADAKGLIEKANIVYNLVMELDSNKNQYYIDRYSAIPFVISVKEQVEKRYWLSKKQMEGLNKVYKKYLKRKEKLNAKGS